MAKLHRSIQLYITSTTGDKSEQRCCSSGRNGLWQNYTGMYNHISHILQAISQNRAVVVQGETICGKTTQVCTSIYHIYYRQ